MTTNIQVGPQTVQDGAQPIVRGAKDASLVTVDGHARYTEPVYRGNVYSLSAAAAAPTAYVGAAAGTPILAIHNPTGSGKNLVFMSAMVANRVAASAAGTVSMGIWAGPSVLPTGTKTNPTNLLSLQTTGSVAAGFVNTALTGSTALSLLGSPFTYYWATAAGAFAEFGLFDIAGLYIIAPGNQIAIGATSALTSATWDVSLVWEEMPI